MSKRHDVHTHRDRHIYVYVCVCGLGGERERSCGVSVHICVYIYTHARMYARVRARVCFKGFLGIVIEDFTFWNSAKTWIVPTLCCKLGFTQSIVWRALPLSSSVTLFTFIFSFLFVALIDIESSFLHNSICLAHLQASLYWNSMWDYEFKLMWKNKPTKRKYWFSKT